MRFRLRTLLIVLALGPPLIAVFAPMIERWVQPEPELDYLGEGAAHQAALAEFARTHPNFSLRREAERQRRINEGVGKLSP
jgi:hypothetical protein